MRIQQDIRWPDNADQMRVRFCVVVVRLRERGFADRPIVVVAPELDVAVLDTTLLGLDPRRRFVAMAEGDAYLADAQGGIVVYEVTDPTTMVFPVAEAATAGVDRALTTTVEEPLQVVEPGPSSASYNGPFVMSVDGQGSEARFGAWRVFQFAEDGSGFALNQIDARLINLSRQAHDRLSGVDAPFLPPTGFTDMSQLFAYVPLDIGVPVDVATIGVQRSYVANTPFIGLQAINLQGMHTALDEDQVHGTYRATDDPNLDIPIRAVATLPLGASSLVVAAAQKRNDNILLLTDGQLIA